MTGYVRVKCKGFLCRKFPYVITCICTALCYNLRMHLYWKQLVECNSCVSWNYYCFLTEYKESLFLSLYNILFIYLSRFPLLSWRNTSKRNSKVPWYAIVCLLIALLQIILFNLCVLSVYNSCIVKIPFVLLTPDALNYTR